MPDPELDPDALARQVLATFHFGAGLRAGPTMHDAVADVIRAYGDRRAAGERAGIVAVLRERAAGHRAANLEIRRRADYEDGGPAGDVAAMEASFAQVLQDAIAAIRTREE